MFSTAAMLSLQEPHTMAGVDKPPNQEKEDNPWFMRPRRNRKSGRHRKGGDAGPLLADFVAKVILQKLSKF
jgi:hypothetical protein